MLRDEQGAARVLLLILMVTICGAASCSGVANNSEHVDRFAFETLPPVDIRLTLGASQARYRERYIGAVRTALRWFGEWYGPYPQSTVALSAPGDVSAHRLSPWSSRQLEQDVARKIARDFWSPPSAPDLSGDSAFHDALLAFSVDRLMREAYSGERAVELRFFGDVVPWVVRSVARGSPPDGAARPLLAIFTLERYLGWPTLQQTLSEFRTREAGRRASAADLITVAGEVSGRDLDWLHALFDSSQTFDYGIERIESRPLSADTTRVEIVVRRYGNGQFTGSTLARTGRFESGRAVSVAVAFADGQQIVETWDGRDVERRFTYESAVAVRSAAVDPDHIIVVDATRANNQLIVSDAASTLNRIASAAWTARWASWLQDRLLLWSALF